MSELTIDLLVYLRQAAKYDAEAKILFDRLFDSVKNVEDEIEQRRRLS